MRANFVSVVEAIRILAHVIEKQLETNDTVRDCYGYLDGTQVSTSRQTIAVAVSAVALGAE